MEAAHPFFVESHQHDLASAAWWTARAAYWLHQGELSLANAATDEAAYFWHRAPRWLQPGATITWVLGMATALPVDQAGAAAA